MANQAHNKEIFVEQHENGCAVLRPNAERARATAETQREAIQCATEIAPDVQVPVERVRHAKAEKSNNWKQVRRNQTPEREARVKARVSAEVARLPLAEVRKAQQMTQVRLAELLQVNQGAISKLEQRSDMYLSTLRSYIEATGGHLEIRAIFPNGEVVLEQLAVAAFPSPLEAEGSTSGVETTGDSDMLWAKVWRSDNLQVKSKKGGRMPNHKEIFVEQHENGDAVLRPNAERASAIAETQREAIQRAREIAPDAQVLVERVRHTSVNGPDKWRKP